MDSKTRERVTLDQKRTRELAVVARGLAQRAEQKGQWAVAAKWHSVSVFLFDVADGHVTVVTQERLFGV